MVWALISSIQNHFSSDDYPGTGGHRDWEKAKYKPISSESFLPGRSKD